ncbi:peptidase domain-containing ABC transporter [Mucilaginibacter terrenus]|uniref:Peptidase domain-containing ABC transporter n=1 Tax=Mucilaginibacter terrenus TaxID=2482727 RepID=A0A3E2NW68_9SPHI|nr:peptidase domain-containing ABC transporter [Mucilaginibacter terrenus]RFZ85161.1 peptidase domain-containing ABC transporter [Mucilaginibacter terrenus]
MRGFKKFPVYRQLDQMDCGPTCLKMVAKYYGKHFSLETLRDLSFITREGVSLKGISEAAEKIGFRTLGARMTFEQLDQEAILPCILYWNQKHFVVLPPQNYNSKSKFIQIVDPGHGLRKVSKKVFLECWANKDKDSGIVLLLEPSPRFFEKEDERDKRIGLGYLLRYLAPFRKLVTQLFIGMIVGSVLSLIAPFLTQSMVDYGINQQNISFIYLILFAQLALFFGSISIELVRGWLLLHISSRINISIISDFLIKLMKLPIRFFDTKLLGDITQRVNDHVRIEQFLSNTTLQTLFSLVNLLVFSIVLGFYSLTVLSLFVVGSLLSIAWMLFFIKKREQLDYERFQKMTDNQNNIYEIITGMQEIKLNNSETMHRWSWEHVQATLFKISVKSLSLEQYQVIGSSFFNQLKNLLIAFIAAKEVLNGQITFGMMLSISYITGQMNSPIDQLINFFRTAQDAKLSLQRLGEIHSKDNEEKGDELQWVDELESGQIAADRAAIVLEDVSFRFGGEGTPLVLNNINLSIPLGKTTAIVGTSGSGKTTLMKLLLRFYEPLSGSVHLGSTALKVISPKWWRSMCGVVMTDGFIFSDTIAKNIAVQDQISQKKVVEATRLANIDEFINSLPLAYQTKIGSTGNGISSGQKQRILLARAFYKDPKYLFLDEATSTLDARNEKIIIENLSSYFKGRTVVVIAHRLSTVKHADQIVVMENGKIVETGNHHSLTQKKGKYFELVKNQLELGN